MTRYLLNESEDPDAPLSWSCLDTECGERVTNLERHTKQRHRETAITVFHTKAALAAARGGVDPYTRYAQHFGMTRGMAKSALFHMVYSAAAIRGEWDLNEIVDAAIKADIAAKETSDG